MTFCLGMNLQGGLVGIADTRVIAGNERITARKVSVFQKDRHAMFLMSAGLRSARDKALIYFEENLAHSEQPLDRLFKAVNAFAAQVRRVAKEDKAALEESGFEFNLHALIGGQLENDPEHRLYLVYPQGNWVEIGQGTPYHIIGAAGYGKPILDRTLHYQDPMRFALKVGCLAFDSTRISAVKLIFPWTLSCTPGTAIGSSSTAIRRKTFRICPTSGRKGCGARSIIYPPTGSSTPLTSWRCHPIPPVGCYPHPTGRTAYRLSSSLGTQESAACYGYPRELIQKTHCRTIANQFGGTFCDIRSDESHTNHCVGSHSLGFLGHPLEHDITGLFQHIRVAPQFSPG